MTEPHQRAKRPPVSCSLCRKRKIRCNRGRPCSNCLRSKNENCVYENQSAQPTRSYHLDGQASESGFLSEPQTAATTDKTSNIDHAPVISSCISAKPAQSSSTFTASTPGSQTSAWELESLKRRIKQLEDQLSKTNHKSIKAAVPAISYGDLETTSRLAGTFYVDHAGSPGVNHPVRLARGVWHKNRLFGQSYWVSGVLLFRDMLEVMEPYLRDEETKIVVYKQKCKSLATIIKSQRKPPWPSPPTTELPRKVVADELIDCYIRTTEGLYRILHIPSFMRDYEALWTSDVEPDITFIVLLKLVLAIGAVTYDEQFSLRSLAWQWIYEAITWISEPKYKSRLNLQVLQINILLLLARERVGVGGDLVWSSMGALMRTAIYMGLHRDPTRLPRKANFNTEMRRRLWNTILELNLQVSMSSGASAFVSLDSFDAEAPRNFDDDQLETEDSEPKPDNEPTQTSVAIAFRKTFPIRLAITTFLNDLSSQAKYEEALRLDVELRASYKVLKESLQRPASNTSIKASKFEIRAIDLLMHRYLLSLHAPFFAFAVHDTAYAFSRKVVVETSLKLWAAAYPSSSVMVANPPEGATTSEPDELARLIRCSAGFFRFVAVQASFLVGVELRTQLEEEESLGPVQIRSDLLSVLDDAKSWNLQCIEIGETNFKGYLFLCLIAAQISGLRQGIRKEDLAPSLMKAAEEACEKCLPILEEKAGVGRTEEVTYGLNQLPMNIPSDYMGDWDFLMPDALFDDGTLQDSLIW